jgi:hypothetical protein
MPDSFIRTPGPWVHVVGDGIHAIVDGHERRIASLSYKGKPITQKLTYGAVMANARLMIAAPQLLQAAANVLKMLEDGDITTVELDELRAAIAYAEGGAQ